MMDNFMADHLQDPNFLGGTFHYGFLNGVEYVQTAPKPKPFIVKNLTKYIK